MTLVLWRIAADTAAYGADDMTGAGAANSGGRWNSKGHPVLYTSTSIALAALETIVHLDGVPLNRYVVRIEVPDTIASSARHLDASAHVGWDALPHSLTSVSAGDAWLNANDSVLLFVPSIVVPDEPNVLINPMHADADSLTCTKVRRFAFDPRLNLSPVLPSGTTISRRKR